MHSQMIEQMKELFPHMVADLEQAQACEDDAAADSDSASQDADDSPHDYADALKPLLVDGADAAQVASVLETRSTFAEDDLRRFLPLLGIAAEWADLSYRYCAQCTEPEIAQAGLTMATHLRFVAAADEDESGPNLKLI
jgi:hypothetical protein